MLTEKSLGKNYGIFNKKYMYIVACLVQVEKFRILELSFVNFVNGLFRFPITAKMQVTTWGQTTCLMKKGRRRSQNEVFCLSGRIIQGEGYS